MCRKHNIIAEASNQHRAHFEILQEKIQTLQTESVGTIGYFYENVKEKNLDPYFTPNPPLNTKCTTCERAKTVKFSTTEHGEKSLGNGIK